MCTGNKGFTLVETLVAILILTMTIGALLTLAASGYFSIRYAKNQIIADYLAEESLEYIRNDRDNALLKNQSSPTDTWFTNWYDDYAVNRDGAYKKHTDRNGCFNKNGCTIDPYAVDVLGKKERNQNVRECASPCSQLVYYPATGFYGYSGKSYPTVFVSSAQRNSGIATTYARKVYFMVMPAGDQVEVSVEMSWKNGNTTKKVVKSILLTKWD